MGEQQPKREILLVSEGGAGKQTSQGLIQKDVSFIHELHHDKCCCKGLGKGGEIKDRSRIHLQPVGGNRAMPAGSIDAYLPLAGHDKNGAWKNAMRCGLRH